MSVKISVIIPVFNREKYIEEAVNSVLAQSFTDFEIIIADDGSTDSTPEICQSLAANDRRIKLIVGEHAGVSAARNYAIDNSSGEYIFFLDSDDIIHPLLLEDLINAATAHNAEIVGSGIINVRDGRWDSVYGIISSQQEPGEAVRKDFETALNEFFTSTTPINLIGGVMMKRSLIADTRFRTELHIGEDYMFIYENLIKKPTAAFLVQKRYYCRIHANNSSWDYGFNGFYTRFTRRRLVWESEERLGRDEHAARQKKEMLGIYLNCMRHLEKISCPDSSKMRAVMKKYRKTLFKSYSLKTKIKFCAVVYVPHTVHLYGKYIKSKQLIKNKIRK